MTLSMYQASIPVFVRALGNLAHVLQKGEQHASAKQVTDEVMLQSRLVVDMLPLVRQVQVAADMAARGAARLAGVEPQSFADTETSFAELQARLARAIDYVKSFAPEQIDGSETRSITIKRRSGEMQLEGQAYLLHFVIPNLFFHCTTAYAILRKAGTDIGKDDFLGAA